MKKDQKIKGIAYRKALAKSKKIVELGIFPTMTETEQDVLVEKLRDAKLATEPTLDKAKATKGQRWYVEDLIEFSKLTGQEKLDKEYDYMYSEMADETEQVSELDAMSVTKEA